MKQLGEIKLEQLKFSVRTYNILINDSVYRRLMQKEQTILNAIDNYKLDSVYTSEEDLKVILGNIFD